MRLELLNKILIIHRWGLGDIIMFTPALQLVARSNPEASIDFLILQRAHAEVIRESKLVRRIFYMETGLGLLRQMKQLRNEGYDCIIIPSGMTAWKSGPFARLICSKMRVGDYAKRESRFYNLQVKRDPTLYRVEQNIKVVESFVGHTDELIRPRFWIGDSAYDQAQQIIASLETSNRALIGIHCGSSAKEAFKRWPAAHFMAMVSQLAGEGNFHFLFFAGPHEDYETNQVAQAAYGNCTVFRNYPLQVVAALISKCRVIIANDSGIGHIAAAVGTPLVSIFGPTDPIPFGHPGDHVINIWSGEKCSPCYPKPPKECRRDCLYSIDPSTVAAAALTLIYQEY